MRKLFALYLDKLMHQDDNIWLLTGDVGYGLWDYIRTNHPNRFINTGAAEQAMLDIAIGLTLAGKIAIAYTITPFVLYRPFEAIRTYIDYEKIPAKLVGGGRNRDYSHDGMSHWADDDIKILSSLDNIKLYKPEILNIDLFNEFMYNKLPSYLNLRIK